MKTVRLSDLCVILSFPGNKKNFLPEMNQGQGMIFLPELKGEQGQWDNKKLRKAII